MYTGEDNLEDIMVKNKSFCTEDKMHSVDFTNTEKTMVGVSLTGDIYKWSISRPEEARLKLGNVP